MKQLPFIHLQDFVLRPFAFAQTLHPRSPRVSVNAYLAATKGFKIENTIGTGVSEGRSHSEAYYAQK